MVNGSFLFLAFDMCLLDSAVHTVFGKPLGESLRYASVQISTANADGELCVWGYIPVVVAKWYVALCTSPPTHLLMILICSVVYTSRKMVLRSSSEDFYPAYILYSNRSRGNLSCQWISQTHAGTTSSI